MYKEEENRWKLSLLQTGGHDDSQRQCSGQSSVNLIFLVFFTPHPLRAVGVLFSPMVSRWAGGRAAGKSLSGLYHRNCKV